MKSPKGALALAAFVACRGGSGDAPEPDSVSPSARLQTAQMLREDLERPRHPSDGGGRAWLDDGPAEVAAGGSGRWSLVYEAGPLGVAEGGAVFLQISPFWGWSTPQVVSESALGYTVVHTDAEGVELEPETVDQQLLAVRIAGRALAEGERIALTFGAGPAGARADRYAERESRFWFAVDGDGDGIRGLVEDPPGVTVVAGPPSRLVLTLPSVARPGDRVRLVAAVLDASANAGVEVAGALRVGVVEGTAEIPARLELGEGGRVELELTVDEPGLLRLEAEGPLPGLRAASNPLLVRAEGTPLYWADLHGHSGLSDGTGTPEGFLRYARDVAGLDAVALTDHDHWGMRPLSQHPEMWAEIEDRTREFHEPGRFVTLLGYEWTSWVHGHRHVLYFADEGRVLSSVDPAYESPRQLWSALEGEPALTVAHHSAGGPIATNWDIPPDPELEPVTEVTSVHGSSEAPDSPGPIYGAVPGNYVRDALDRGYRLGFVGSGDSHDGHPGLAHLESGVGGLAAILAEELSREGLRAALRARRVYATNGPRILLEVTLEGRPMGSLLEAGRRGKLRVRVAGTGTLQRVDLVSGGRVVESAAAEALDWSGEWSVGPFDSGAYLYVRAVQADGGAAWSSPFFFE